MKKFLLVMAVSSIAAWWASGIMATMDDDLMAGRKTLLQRAIVVRTAMMLRDQLPPRVTNVRLEKGKGLVETKVNTGKVADGVKPAEISGARLYWSPAVGRGWQTSNFESSRTKPGIMDTQAPGPLGGDSVFSIRAWDSKGSITAGLACQVKKWPPAASVWNSSCMWHSSGEKLEQCLAEAVPSGCVFPLAADESPVDDKPSRAGDDMDMVGVYAAYDDKQIHIAIAVQRLISPGSLTPVSLSQYGFVIMNPLKIAPASEELLPHGGGLVRYLPLGEKSPDFAAPCSIVRTVEGQLIEETETVSCESSGGIALISVDREVVGKNADELILIAHTGILSGLRLEDFSFINMTPPVRIVLGKPEYKVVNTHAEDTSGGTEGQ